LGNRIWLAPPGDEHPIPDQRSTCDRPVRRVRL